MARLPLYTSFFNRCRAQELLDKSDAEDMDANAAALEDMYPRAPLCVCRHF
jgi:hypothetical protein